MDNKFFYIFFGQLNPNQKQHFFTKWAKKGKRVQYITKMYWPFFCRFWFRNFSYSCKFSVNWIISEIFAKNWFLADFDPKWAKMGKGCNISKNCIEVFFYKFWFRNFYYSCKFSVKWVLSEIFKKCFLKKIKSGNLTDVKVQLDVHWD